MDLNNLDEYIKKSLEESTPEYDPTTWDQLSSRMDKENLADSSSNESIDPIVREKLTKHEVPLNDSHWIEFIETLDKEESRRRRMGYIKLAEFVIFLLLILTFSNYHNLRSGVHLEMDAAYINDIENNSTGLDQILDFTRETRTESQNVLKSTEIVKIGRLADPLRSPMYSLSQEDKNVVGFSEFTQNEDRSKSSFLSSFDHSSRINNQAPILELLQIIPLDNDITTSAQLPLPQVLMTDSYELDNNQGLSISIPVSYDANFINSSIDLSKLTDGFIGGIDGGSVGIKASYRNNNFEGGSGLIFSSKTYIPGAITNYSKTSDKSILESKLDASVFKQLSIPIELKYHLSEKKISFYVSAGAYLNTIVHSDYTVRRTVQPNVRLGTLSAQLLDLKTLPQGLAQGGGFRNNVYYSVSAGFGVQALLTNGISVFFAPNYQHSISGQINELMESINVLSFESGLKFKF